MAEVGVGTVAAGVAKAHSDVVLISGHDGGTGASPLTSIKHGGVPWELGLAETQQVLVLNKLRDRIVVQVDGQMKTGRDVVIAALLGAEEFGFSTAPLVVMGCIMMRVCHLNTCPVGIATQDPELRQAFTGEPEFVANFFRFIAEEVRELMAELGFRTMDEMIGRVDRLDVAPAVDHWKARGLDFSAILYQPADGRRTCRVRRVRRRRTTGSSASLDLTTLMPLCQPALEHGTPVELRLPIRNVQPDRGHDPRLRGHAAATAARGCPTTRSASTSPARPARASAPSCRAASPSRSRATPTTTGARGSRAASSSSSRRARRRSSPEENILIGNVALYGATSGEAYVRGVAGERFAVRNSGALAVVEGVGRPRLRVHDRRPRRGHRPHRAGTSPPACPAASPTCSTWTATSSARCNLGMVDLEPLVQAEDVELVRELSARHVRYTESAVAAGILVDWVDTQPRFVKVMPRDYKRVLAAMERARAEGIPWERAVMEGAHG